MQVVSLSPATDMTYLYVFWCTSITTFRALPAVRQIVINNTITCQLRVCLTQAVWMNNVPTHVTFHQLPLRVVCLHRRRVCCRIHISACCITFAAECTDRCSWQHWLKAQSHSPAVNVIIMLMTVPLILLPVKDDENTLMNSISIQLLNI